MSEELAASAVAALDFIADQHSTVALAGVCQSLGKLRRSHLYAAHTLDTFEDNGSHTTLGQLANPWLEIVQWQEANVMIVVDGGYNLRIVGYLHSQARASVESLLAAEHTRIARLKRSQFQRVLIGLGTAVDEEQLVVVVAANLAQTLCQLHLQFIDD